MGMNLGFCARDRADRRRMSVGVDGLAGAFMMNFMQEKLVEEIVKTRKEFLGNCGK
jgi:hypothetical protein